ncbi:3',5'-cyclic AMP phosphodiesterase CpdA [Humitalea rosea]|uniref:3',5'-cyclic AMP phosphodiesterase CpdA n=1 Tax=Humitalea rosea TaxID=990373 RepID=A0A2W7IUZ0_9PROT|nr:metallophosphoesterase [Humitalea rosea]PZW50333.1 3',5'-cyclic AMP phosphodiesterase CpdA [Humitalea rosea]
MSRIVFLSDLHLSPKHGFFWKNFALARDAANVSDADAVVVCGDLCIDGPDSDTEMGFAALALDGLEPPVFALPGNHDVGDEPPGQDARQIIDEDRLARWDQAFETDRFMLDAGVWRLIGVNAQLFGSGLPREDEQEAWLARELTDAGDRPVALVLHKPLFLEREDEDEATAATLNPAPRARLLALLRRAGVRLVISGHLHATRDREIGGIRHLWLPALAFLGKGGHGGVPAVGALLVDFAEAEVRIEPLALPGLEPHELDAIKGHGLWRFLREMPACPPVLGPPA